MGEIMNNKKLIIIRYFILVTLIFSIVGYKENLVVYTVISVLLFIINNQIRFFMFNEIEKGVGVNPIPNLFF